MEVEKLVEYVRDMRQKGRAVVHNDDAQDFKDWLDNRKVQYTTSAVDDAVIFTKKGLIPE